MKNSLPVLALVLVMAGLGSFAASAGAQRPGRRGATEVIRDSERYRRTTVPDTRIAAGTAAGTENPVLRCGTAPLRPQEQADLDERARPLLQSRGLGSAGKVTTVDVFMHVIHDGKRGMVADADIVEQVKVLDRAFRRHGLRFRLAGITRTRKRSWFRKCGQWSRYRKMTDALAVDPAHSLNIYTCDPNGVLGFVWDLPGGPSGITGTNQDGVVVLHSTLPNGSAAPYNEGDTVTHEVGHWAGLYHTFQNGCNAPGDRVDDTAPESSPAYGCPRGRDSCVGAGNDPIRNFMDYVDDACMRKFTPGQGQRMREQVAIFRSGL